MKKLFLSTIFFAFLFVGTLNYSIASTNASNSETESTEQIVREYFSDIPVMIEIARCESKFRQFTDNGGVLRGGLSGQMIGVFQFFEKYHQSSAVALGLDINTTEGNMAYARHIYEQQGTTPWDSSRDCWKIEKVTNSTDSTSAKTRANLEKQIELLLQIIELLKQLKALQS